MKTDLVQTVRQSRSHQQGKGCRRGSRHAAPTILPTSAKWSILALAASGKTASRAAAKVHSLAASAPGEV